MKVSISTLSTAYGLTPEALRYYEEKGLLSPKRTASSGFRQFSINDVQILGIIKSLQRQGFSLDEIHNVISSGCSLETLLGLLDEKRAQLAEQAAFAQSMCSRITICTDLLRDSTRLLMQPRICQGVAAYLLDFDSVSHLWECVPKSPVLHELIDALPLSSYCSFIPLSCFTGGSIVTRTAMCAPVEYSAFIHADFTQMKMCAGARSLRILFDLQPPQRCTLTPVITLAQRFLEENDLTPASAAYTRQYAWHIDETGSMRQYSELIVPIL